ncbi:MAG TPA: hypothetical protein VGB38_04245 [bacterium]
MKKLLFPLVFASCFAGWRFAQAHPPSDIRASFDPGTHLLELRVVHDTRDTLKHFIERVEVRVNDGAWITQVFFSQESKPEQKAVYLVMDLKTGDAVTIEGRCNVHGKKTKTINI